MYPPLSIASDTKWVEGIASDDLPPHRLFERTAQKFYDLLDGLVADISRCRLARLCGNGSSLLQGLNVSVHYTVHSTVFRGVTACTSISPIIGFM